MFGWFTYIGCKETKSRISCVWQGFILSIIQTYIIWMKALLGNKLNDFCLNALCFWFSSNFCSDFYFSLSKRTEIFLHNWGSSIWLTLLWECSLEFLSITIVFSANWGECLIWRFHLNYFLILTTIFFPICFSLSYEDLDS